MKYSLTTIAFYIGFIGDILLQIIIKMRGDVAHLKQYYSRHGPLESLFIAGGMMYLLMAIYEQIGFKLTYINLFIYGGVLDILWRQFHLFPTLTYTYYTANNQIQSFFWGGISMILVIFFDDVFQSIQKSK